MNEKDSRPKEPKAAKQSRRAFLKTGAAAAGAALLGAAVKATPTTAADQAQDKEEVCQALFVQDAKGVELKKDSVILKEPNDQLIFFCDRPKHEAGFLTWDALMEESLCLLTLSEDRCPQHLLPVYIGGMLIPTGPAVEPATVPTNTSTRSFSPSRIFVCTSTVSPISNSGASFLRYFSSTRSMIC